MRSGRKGILWGSRAAAALFLVAFALLIMTPSPARAVSFPDVGAQEWFAEAADVLSDLGIVQGKADGTFHPYDPVSARSSASFSVALWGWARGAATCSPTSPPVHGSSRLSRRSPRRGW